MKYTIEKTPVEQCRWLIKHCYDKDGDMIDSFHEAAGTGLDGITENTFTTLQYGTVGFEFYVLKDEAGEAIGYFGREVLDKKDYLTSFAIAMDYRTEEVKKALWKFIRATMSKTFYCGLYRRNPRAVKFIENMGMKYMDVNENEGEAILIFKNK